MQRRVVIMAGGAGERFWPASRQGRPKQLLRLLGDRTMLELAVERLAPLIAPEQVTIVLGADIEAQAREVLARHPGIAFLVEPARRNTCACLALAHAFHLEHHGPHVCAVVTADHTIKPEADFRAHLDAALRLAEEERRVVLFGMKATRPDTAYGYIEAAAPVRPGAPGPRAFQVARFTEKPPRELAERYLAAGNYYWNSGMFFWRSDVFSEALHAHAPAHAALEGTFAPGRDAARLERFLAAPPQPIDRAIMEKLSGILMLEATFEWDDVGSWTSLERLHEPDADGNIAVGGAVLRDSRGCIVYGEGERPGDPSPRVAVLGCHNLVIAVSGNRVLVMPKDRAQDVKLVGGDGPSGSSGTAHKH
ncbi:MAG: sugar phosphate nucleotidyltransferase [Candidatus Sumerlaeia bacterium]|nr:sugar phosphate nucleotidyltransferase [Candidatus Sumerlaeia bacterium]